MLNILFIIVNHILGYSALHTHISNMALQISVNTGNIELDNKISEWLKWNKVFNLN